ncbi:cycloisomerase [Elioraea sp. Yellowstone]|jgi:muconate cycloisomerase|uniref:enolase C-terminal domain-like protein n=1 Tax=Elioraea sp. Yellowstone TaxID=2592070 RepID=UPI001153DEDF|nr:enolase C-terminal domain-like protein [Elioraea sp. Yellowstone]TQF83097.1 cycloisomerase [Elioraea sp. Yellowstone]
MPDLVERMEVLRIDSEIAMRRAHGSGAIARRVGRVILRLLTADGIEGLGEAAPWAPFGNTADTTAAAIDGPLRAVVEGADATRIAALVEAMDHALIGHPEAKAAVEMALWDIAGKRLGVPVHALLGGAVRETIPLSFSIADPDFAADLDRARAMAGQGIGIFKVKTGFLTHADDLDRLSALRETCPAADIRADYNQGLAPEEALRLCRDLDPLGLGFIEQPVRRGQERVLALIAAALDTPVMADESVYSAREMLDCAQAGWADCVSIKLMKAGGILRAREADAVATAAGIPTYGGTLWEGGIALAAAAHLIAASPNIRLGCEFYMPRYVLARDVTAEPFPYEGGAVRVPDGPGLGVTLDEETLRADLVAARG